MKHVFAMISAIVLTGSLGIGAARAMPRIDTGATAAAAAPTTEKARIVCNYRRCFHTGYYRPYYYRPYGYYRPYYRPHLGIGIGPFGVGIY